MLNDIRKLGSGNYGSVMLVEVDKHPEIRMAVKVKLKFQLWWIIFRLLEIGFNAKYE